MITPRNKGKSSERIAEELLRSRGYTILETNKIVEKAGEDAFEVDIIALNQDGEKYCVEVKAGEASISDIRHVYANSQILSCKPLIICKMLSHKSSETVAEELNVQVISLSDTYLINPEELEIVVRSAIQDVLTQFGFFPLPPPESITKKEIELISVLAQADSFSKAANKLKVSNSKLGNKLGKLRKKGILPTNSQSFSELKQFSKQIIQQISRIKRIKRIEKRIKKLEKEIKKLQEKIQ